MPLETPDCPSHHAESTPAPLAPPVIHFVRGMPGFPGATQFTLHALARSSAGFVVMRSVDDPALRFLMLPCSRGALPLRPAELADACARHGLRDGQVEVLLIVTLQPNGAEAELRFHVNRRAPVLVDVAQCVGVQHVLDDPAYALRAPLARAA